MQYDSPVTSAQFTNFLQTAAISSNTAAAISSVLNLGTGSNVNLASWDGVNAPQTPTGQTGNAQVVVAQIPGAGTDLVHVDIPASLASAKAFVFNSNASLDITFAAPAVATASVARLAVAQVATTGFDLVINTGAGNDVITVKGNQNTYIDAGNGNDTIVTGNGNNTVVAGAGNNNVTTGSGNDTIILSGTGHTDIVNAGDGFDIVKLDGSASSYSVTTGNTNNITLTGGQTASITDAEFLSFADGSTIALAHNDAEASALRLFSGLLGRDADAGGVQHFATQVEAGTSLTDIANQFLASAEFTGKANQTHLDSLFDSLLGRTADAGGLATFEAALGKGASLADIAGSIAVSAEAQARDQSNHAFVTELYQAALGRDGTNDAAGVNSWVSQLFNGASRAEVASSIVGSAEAAAKINGDFVNSLYLSATGRQADVAGKATWTDMLAHGSTHADVAIGIVGSAEAVAHNDNVVVLHGAV